MAFKVQYSSGTKFLISFSLSIINFNVALCTLPADKPDLIFAHNNGEIWNPTNLSRILLLCCASTKSWSIFLGFFAAFCTSSFVISLKVTLDSLVRGISKICAKCHAIASPSLSGSVAKYTSLPLASA